MKKMNNQFCDRLPRSFRHYYINVLVGRKAKSKGSGKRGKIVGRLRVLSLARGKGRNDDKSQDGCGSFCHNGNPTADADIETAGREAKQHP
jgi:hypothetical protein